MRQQSGAPPSRRRQPPWRLAFPGLGALFEGWPGSRNRAFCVGMKHAAGGAPLCAGWAVVLISPARRSSVRLCTHILVLYVRTAMQSFLTGANGEAGLGAVLKLLLRCSVKLSWPRWWGIGPQGHWPIDEPSACPGNARELDSCCWGGGSGAWQCMRCTGVSCTATCGSTHHAAEQSSW